MHPFIVLLAAAWTVYASDTKIAPETTAPSYAGNKRAGSTATVTLGPTSDFTVSLTSGAPTASGTSFTIVPAGDKAEDGVNFIPGPDLLTQLKSVHQAKCGDPKSDDCHNAILDLLPIEQVSLQRRQVGLLVDIGIAIRYIFAGIVLAVGIVQGAVGYHAPGNVATQADTATSASAYAILPSASATPTIISVQPSDTPDPTPSIGAGASGGFSINAAQDLAGHTDDLAAVNSHGCPAPANKRDLSMLRLFKRDPPDAATVACLVALTVTLVRNMVHGPLADWVRLNRNNRQIAPAGAGAAVVLANVENQVAPLQQEVGLAQDQWRAVIQVAYWQAYNRVVLRQHDSQVVQVSEDDMNMQYCPPKSLVKCSDDDCNGSAGKCADSSPLKNCDCGAGDSAGSCDPKVTTACTNCGGDAGGNKCNGVGDKNSLKGCDCWPVVQQGPGLFKSATDLKAAQQALLNLKDLPANAGSPTDGSGIPAAHCELRKRDSSTGLVDMDTGFFTSLCKVACKGYPGDPSASFDKKLTNKDADSQYQNVFNGYTIEFKWVDKPGSCSPDTCQSIFSSFTTSTTQCSPDSHTMAQSGSIDMNCGTASFAITTGSTSSSSPTSTSTPAPSNCPQPYPVNADQGTYKTWWDANHCDTKCPGGMDQTTCTPGFNDVAGQWLCTCNAQTCTNSAFCADQRHLNPWN